MTAEVKLFRITRGPLTWRYTSVRMAVTHDGEVYAPAAIKHSEIHDGGDRNKVSITLEMPRRLEVADNWWPWPPQDAIVLTIITLEDGVPFVDWIGRLVAPKFTTSKLTLLSEPSSVRSRRGGKGRKFQRGCDLILYSQGRGQCNVDPVAHALPATLDAVNRLTLQSSAFLALPAGRLAGGWFEWERENGLIERRSIEQHPGNTVLLDYGHDDLVPGLQGTAYPGCAQDYEDCSYYENTDNYGGYLYMPGRNYWDGNPVR